ncbi:MAG: SRPBCC domain-containing protein [Cyanobacteriota bacterium]|jgi:hypothetical protein|nr:SRPBCC domain-containing protein [Cyanobacteriota bacterium]
MPSFHSETTIEAPRFAVWDALVRKQEWHRWNTFLYDGDPTLPMDQGKTVSLALRRREGEEGTEFQARILVFQPNRCLRWIAKAPGFRSEHLFDLEEVGANRTRYIHQEHLSGLLARLMLPLVHQDEKQGIRRMTQQLKRYVEYHYLR